jgi:hypothetical protein
MGYDIFDHYDLGDKGQKGTVARGSAIKTASCV